MGKNRHSKDRMFITATEWATEYGGKKTVQQHGYRPLPFNHCAISLSPYETPCCTPEGVLFDLANLVPYVMKHKKNPVTGASMTTQEIIRLNMAKNSGELYVLLFFFNGRFVIVYLTFQTENGIARSRVRFLTTHRMLWLSRHLAMYSHTMQ